MPYEFVTFCKANSNMLNFSKLFFYLFSFIDCFYPFVIMQLLLFLHECLSFASLSAVPHVSFILFKSPSKVFLMVIFGFHLKPFLGILFCSILSTCPSHLCLCLLCYVVKCSRLKQQAHMPYHLIV